MKERPKGVSVYRIPRHEQVYTFRHSDTGLMMHFAVDQLNAYIRAAGLQAEPVIIHADLLQHLTNRGGWEPKHLEGLSDEAMKTPCTLLDMGDGTHVLADGVHRVLKHAHKGLETFPAYVVREPIWSRFKIYDFPDDLVDWDDFLANGSRHQGMSQKNLKRVSW